METSNTRPQRWQNKVLETNAPPTIEELEQFSAVGYELVTVIHWQDQGKWFSYFKRPSGVFEQDVGIKSYGSEIPY
jgi:hypothetical protein